MVFEDNYFICFVCLSCLLFVSYLFVSCYVCVFVDLELMFCEYSVVIRLGNLQLAFVCLSE